MATDQPIVCDDFVLGVAATYAATNKTVYDALNLKRFGISSAAINGPILQEFSDRYETTLDILKQSTADLLAAFAYETHSLLGSRCWHGCRVGRKVDDRNGLDFAIEAVS